MISLTRLNNLRDDLIDVCKNKGQIYHWRNEDSARTFLFTLHRDHFNAEAVKVCFSLKTALLCKKLACSFFLSHPNLFLNLTAFDYNIFYVFMQLLAYDRPDWRLVAAECIACFLEWNKPKCVRTIWKPPKKVDFDLAVNFGNFFFRFLFRIF
ncbi:unnamed protein product [Gongylonema pulchrum]|uniref:Uncharacterized protein n=1 Tax=Gongylonema pulchrum TaxID=637853 RepID=A0A183EY49_9BILA|nr:unnamed protein product [Gongylonema pulchrum]